MYLEMRRHRFILLPLSVGLIVVLTATLFALPKARAIIKLKGELAKEKERLSRLTEKATFLAGLDEYELERKVAVAEKALPSKKVMGEIFAALSFLSSEGDVSLSDLTVSPGKFYPEKFEELSFKITFKSSRDELKSFFFIGKINQILPVMKVKGFNIKRKTINLKLESYFSPTPKSLGKIDTPLPKISREEEKVYGKISQLKSFEERLPAVPRGREDPFSEF